ncbi:MAG: SRPBCC family protein [Pseudonocardia sp.]|nr:SRPBCC family protein [Pseudonocardia sp.]
MELTHTFTVSEPVDRAWAVITDLERVAPCLPGATMLGVEGEDYRGAVAVKVGPVTARYEGVARFTERDDDKHHAVIRAEGRDVGGQGNAAATIDIQLREQGSGTEVVVMTDLDLAGRVAQFGRGVISDVSSKLIGQFARRLEAEMAEGGAPGAAGAGAPAATGRGAAAEQLSAEEPEPLDLLATSGGVVWALARRHALPVGTALLGLALGLIVGRARRRPGPAHGAGQAGSLVLQLVLPGAHTNSREGDR